MPDFIDLDLGLKSSRAYLSNSTHFTQITYKYHPVLLCFVDPVLLRSLKYCDERVVSCCALQRTALEQELGLAAYLVHVEEQKQHGPRVSSDLSESDPDKLSSTDNEEEESVVDGQLSGPPQ